MCIAQVAAATAQLDTLSANLLRGALVSRRLEVSSPSRISTVSSDFVQLLQICKFRLRNGTKVGSSCDGVNSSTPLRTRTHDPPTMVPLVDRTSRTSASVRSEHGSSASESDVRSDRSRRGTSPK